MFHSSLRDYQIEAIKRAFEVLKKNQSALIVASTGAGKTRIFSEIIRIGKERSENFKAVVLSNRITLVEQNNKAMASHIGEDVSNYCASLDSDFDHSVISASIQSIKDLDDFPDGVKVLIVDEAHNYTTGGRQLSLLKFKEKYPAIKIIFFTATPWSPSGKDLHNELRCPLAYRIYLNDLVKMGFLVPPVFKSTKESFDTLGLKVSRSTSDFKLEDLNKMAEDVEKAPLQVADALSRLGGRKKIVWVCINIQHAQKIRNEITEIEPALIIHSKLKNPREELSRFQNEEVRHMVSVAMLTEGYDYPAIDAIVLLRPTRSAIMYVQVIGRGLRLSPGKTSCQVLDYGGAVEALGHPNDPDVQYKGKQKKKIKKHMECAACGDIIFFYPCPGCDHSPPIPDKLLSIAAGGKSPSISIELNLPGAVHIISRFDINEQYKSNSGNVGTIIDFFSDSSFFPIRKFYFGPTKYDLKKDLSIIKGGTPFKIEVKTIKNSRFPQIRVLDK